jgi:dTDP-4-dehydrorhamnose 3,5-epimerase
VSFKFKIINLRILPEVKKILHSSFNDKRGTIFTTIENDLTKKILPKKYYFNQNKINYRKKNVLVGIHYDNKTWKLLTCVKGKIFHVVTNINGSKKNKFKSEINILSEKKSESILIPPGYGNSFYCLKNSIINYSLAYKGSYINYDKQKTVSWKEKKLNIKWPCKRPRLSPRDNL